ncbi:MAG: hydrogenase formation protein HypD [Pseudomonadota bacterium]
MKFVDEYRDPGQARRLAAAIAETATQPWTLMEVCGGQTHAIMKFGIDQLLPKDVTLLHGPGCPVCVTPALAIDQAIALAEQNDVVLCTFGDMIRVPGSGQSLSTAKARGGDVRIVYSPLDALALAEATPNKEIVFFAIGFETTAPTTAMAAFEAQRRSVQNFSLLVSHVRVPPALDALLTTEGPKIDAFLAAGHVCAIMGLSEYEPICARHGVPIVATGFEPVDILEGVLMCVRQLEADRAEVENQYARAVRHKGNGAAQELISAVFEVADQEWRGIGELAASGLRLRETFRAYNAAKKFALAPVADVRSETPCISGDVLRGVKRPNDCPAFGKACSPERPLGATMVSSEGACAAYYRYARKNIPA